MSRNSEDRFRSLGVSMWKWIYHRTVDLNSPMLISSELFINLFSSLVGAAVSVILIAPLTARWIEFSQRGSTDNHTRLTDKLRSRGMDFGILISPRGITGNADDLTAAHSIVAAALRERRKLVVITTGEILGLADTEALSPSHQEKTL